MKSVHQLIRASAGAGKTYQLTNRYLSLLAHQVPADRILATTFTRKAAGEILGRVLGRLAKATRDEKEQQDLGKAIGRRDLSAADCRQILSQLVHMLHRLSISTIDSFFNRIASSFRFELDMPLEPQLVDEKHPIARQVRLEAIEAMLADDDLHVILELLRRVHHDSAARSVTQAIDGVVVDLYDVYRQAPHRELWSRIEVPDTLLDEDELVACVQAVAGSGELLPRTKKGTPNAVWLKAWEKTIDHARQRNWDALLGEGLIKKIVAGDEKFSTAEIANGWRLLYQPLIGHARAWNIQQIAQMTRATFDLLDRFDSHYTKQRTQRGLLLFSDLTHKLARQLPQLGDDVLMDVYFRLDSQVQHLLLDEFQDTSLDQWSVLSPMAEEILAVGDGSRSFFCVGDTKQAIYGWRGGCAELFDLLEDQLEGYPGAIMHLAQTWRSSQIVLDAVNRVFTQIGSCEVFEKWPDREAAERWQAQFETHAAARDLPGYVQLMTTPAPDNGDERSDNGNGDDEAADDANGMLSAASTHEQFVAQQVRDIYQQMPGCEIGVLVSTNRAAHRMIFELRRMGLPVSGEGGNPLVDVPAVAAILAALTLADHPGHSAAAFHVANSPLGEAIGLTTTRRSDVGRVSLAIRQSLISDGYASVIADWVRRIAPSCNPRTLSRLMQLVDLAQRYSPLQTLRPSEFVRFVEATPVEEPLPAVIRVMTVHASKGLEFDVVVLPELNRPLRDRYTVLVDRPEPTGEIEAVYRFASEAVRQMIPELEAVYDQQRQSQRSEDLCSLYVAMTRARYALHMFVKPLELTSRGQPRREGLCYATMLRQCLRETEETFDGQEILYERGDAQWWQHLDQDTQAVEPATVERANEAEPVKLAKASVAQRNWLAVSPSSLEGTGRVRAADLLDLHSDEARQRGTLMHAWFEQVGYVDEDDAVPSDEHLLQVARDLGLNVSDAWLSEQLAQFHAMLQQPAVQSALQKNGAATLWRERSFAIFEDGKLLRGTFDRVVIWRDGEQPTKAALLDFKTDYAPDAAAVEAAVARYQPQLAAYRRALSRMLNLPAEMVAAQLVFVGVGKVVDV